MMHRVGKKIAVNFNYQLLVKCNMPFDLTVVLSFNKLMHMILMSYGLIYV